MNKIFFTKAIFLVILFVIGISSCETDFWAVDSGNSYKKFYTSRETFEYGMADITPSSERIIDDGPLGHVLFTFPVTKADHINLIPTIYYDGRDEAGNSTWSDPLVTKDASSVTVSDYHEGFLYHIKVNVTKGLNTPPVHLHLCLRTWDEETGYQFSRLSWKVKSIVDDKGKDLTKDPEWKYYTDNRMEFLKTDRFYFYPGYLRSAKETELFGVNSMIIGSYKVAKTTTGEVKLTLVFPNFNTIFTVLESRFGYIKVSGISDGKKGILELAPAD